MRDPEKIILNKAPRSVWHDESKTILHDHKEAGDEKIFGKPNHFDDRVGHLFNSIKGGKSPLEDYGLSEKKQKNTVANTKKKFEEYF